MARTTVYRWFTDLEARRVYPPDDHELHGRIFTADLRNAYPRGGPKSRAAAVVRALRDTSPEFTALWGAHEIGTPHETSQRIQHHDLGVLELDCQILLDPDQSQVLLVFTAAPGTDSYAQLQLLRVIGTQRMSTSSPVDPNGT